MSQYKTIGIVGGVGPYAGLDLNEKIFRLTRAKNDQEHLNVILFSFPSQIPDRTEFLSGEVDENPANGIARVLKNLEHAGVEIAGIPCNTAHSPKIWEAIENHLLVSNSKIYLVNMIQEVARFIKGLDTPVDKVGILGTDGTVKSDVYGQVLQKFGLQVVYPEEKIQQPLVHAAIYDPEYGIKAQSNPVTLRAKSELYDAVHSLVRGGADVVVLGCTEIPLAITEETILNTPVIDATMILARAIIQKAAPDKLK